VVGRFLNADNASTLGAHDDVYKVNLYAYCDNDPINYTDPDGLDRKSEINLYNGIGFRINQKANAPIKVSVSGNTVTITARFKFSGNLAEKVMVTKGEMYKRKIWCLY